MTSNAATACIDALPTGEEGAVAVRSAALLGAHRREIWRRTDKLFMGLLVFQWIGGIILALWLSPRTWDGAVSSIHPHVWQAVVVGGLIVVAPLIFSLLRPGDAVTRHVIAASQMLHSALLIHLGGGRIEMHFHVFGSLAFLAFYRDWRVLITASVVVAADHLIRGAYFPESTYGILDASRWRWLEHAAWVVFEDIFLITSCLQSQREMRLIADRQAQLESSYERVEEKVRQRTRELQAAQQELVTMARSAGKAEVASSVLHNVGNVLNSVNVSLRLATTKVQDSAVGSLGMAVKLMGEHAGNLGQFLSADEMGKRLPGFLRTVADVMNEEQASLLGELHSLGKNIEHIKQIVEVQQSHAKAAGMSERLNLAEIVEDALRVNLLAGDDHSVDVRREFGDGPEIASDKHTILQILINLLGNARQAILNNSEADRHITIRMAQGRHEEVPVLRIEVEDNGVGIAPENLTRIFNYGFTTKTTGHGFGLHSAANAARQLGGWLSAASAGPGRGATFALELPLTKTEVPA